MMLPLLLLLWLASKFLLLILVKIYVAGATGQLLYNKDGSRRDVAVPLLSFDTQFNVVQVFYPNRSLQKDSLLLPSEIKIHLCINMGINCEMATFI